MAGSECRVFLRERCVINPEPAAPAGAPAIPFLGLFVPKLIEIAIGGVATLLRKAGKDETVTVAGRAFTDLYVADDAQALRASPKIGCIIGVVGTFGTPEPGTEPSTDPIVRRLEDEGFVPRGAEIAVLFEAVVKRSSDETAFFLDTRHMSVRNFIGDRGRSERAFVITLGVTAPGATADGETIAIGTIDMGRLRRDASLVPDGAPAGARPRYRSNLMPWGQISKASQEVYDAEVAAGAAAGRSYMPVTFELTVSETADGNALLLALGDLLDGAKKEAAAEAAKLILPDERAKADATRAESAEALYEAELEAEVEVRKAKKAHAAGSGGDLPVLRAQLEAAIRKLRRATQLREAAGLPARPPIPES